MSVDFITNLLLETQTNLLSLISMDVCYLAVLTFDGLNTTIYKLVKQSFCCCWLWLFMLLTLPISEKAIRINIFVGKREISGFWFFSTSAI